MLVVEVFPKSSIFQMGTIVDINETASETINDNKQDSISPITIPLKSSQLFLGVSSTHILVNEIRKKTNKFVIIDDNLKRFPTDLTINETILDAIWYNNDKKFFLLTKEKMYTFDPNNKIIETIPGMETTALKPFKSFTIIDNQSSLLIAYNEWESKFIDRWEQDNETKLWKLIQNYPVNLNANETISNIFVINKHNDLNIGIIIYNELYQEWRIDIRNLERLICLKTMLLPGSDPVYDYKIIAIKSITSDIKWLVYSQMNNVIIVIDSNWKQKDLYYKYPVYKMVQFREKNLIIRSKNKLDIHLFV